jgi:superkiller protein 3
MLWHGAIKAAPFYALAWTNKGYSLANVGRYKEALQSFDAATALDPESIKAWRGRATVLKIPHRDDEAKAAQDKVEALGKTGE